MKKLIILFAALGMFSCNQDDHDSTKTETTALETQDILSVAEINEYITGQLEVEGDIDWKKNPEVLYSAAVHGGNMLTVGYGKEGEAFSKGARKSTELISAKREIIQTVEALKITTDEEAVLIAEDPVLNVMDIHVHSIATIRALLNDENVRYIEPNGYNQYRPKSNLVAKSDSGCDKNSQQFNSADFSAITPGALQPWNYSIHNIDEAWAISTGSGVTVGLIDTGLSANQSKLGSGFNDGQSSGRSVAREGVFIDSPWFWSRNTDGPNDKCGHGTAMASAIASPRNNDNLPLGVAYNSNLISYRAVEDVLITDYHEKKGVSDALVALANRSDVKIISMSLGSLFSIGNVRDAVRYAYSKGKLIFVAGGTSTSFTTFVGVTFPASMPEAVAVTGVTDAGSYQKCNNCHSGYQIEFTIAMQRAGQANRTVPVLAFNEGQSKYIGGSSVATAMTAGIAALVWSKNPSWSRDQVLDKMRKAGDLYPNRDGQFGYGNIDALKAVQ